MQVLGTIISREDSPSTSQFLFVLDKHNDSVKKGQFIQVNTSDGDLFGYVNELFRANRYYEMAESVAEYEKSGPGTMGTNFPVNEWEYALGEVKILGKFNRGKFLRTYSPPAPGAKVYLADNSILHGFLGFSESGLAVGNIQHHELEAKLDLSRLFQKHLAILAMSGAGKSHLASVLIEELLKRKKEDGRIAVVVIDIHGEYIGFKFDEKFGAKTTLVDASEISLPPKKVSSEMFEEWLPNLSIPQRELLRQAIGSLRKSEGAYGLKDIAIKLEDEDLAHDNVKKTLKRSLRELARYGFLKQGKENPNLLRDVRPGEILLLDFSTIDSIRKKQILVSMVARRLFKLRKKEKIPPFLLLIEEAHNFAREKAEASEAISKGIIETIAREGRKFGASLCLITQRPVNLSTTALSQCSTHIILRITNPNDLDHIQMSSEGIDSRVAKSITSLRIGEAIFVGEAVNYPIFVNIRQRQSTKREKGQPLHEQAKHFEETQKKKEEQVEAFL